MNLPFHTYRIAVDLDKKTNQSQTIMDIPASSYFEAFNVAKEAFPFSTFTLLSINRPSCESCHD